MSKEEEEAEERPTTLAEADDADGDEDASSDDSEDYDDSESDGDDDDDHVDDAAGGEKRKAATNNDTKEKEDESPPKKARIAMPPAVAQSLLDVDEYTLDEPPTSENTDDDRIDTPCIILFGLHPLIREPPLKKMCEKYGEVKVCGVRSAFASRYGHVEYASVEEAKGAYRALNGAKLLHKPILVQPSKSAVAATAAVN